MSAKPQVDSKNDDMDKLAHAALQGIPDELRQYVSDIVIRIDEQTGEAVIRVVRHVLIHEIGHHFGFSDDDMERIENQD